MITCRHYNFHPSLDELTVATTALTDTVNQLEELNAQAKRCADAVNPVVWADLVQGYYNSPVALAKVKARRREALLRFEAAMCKQAPVRRRAAAASVRLRNAIKDSVDYANMLEEGWLKRIIMNNVLVAEAQRLRAANADADSVVRWATHLAQHQNTDAGLHALHSAFQSLQEIHKALPHYPGKITIGSPVNLYAGLQWPEEPVVPTEGVFVEETREVQWVEFVDVPNGQNSALKELALLLPRFEVVLRNLAQSQADFLDFEHGAMDEAQYAKNLCGTLDFDYAAGPIETWSKLQAESRVEFQSARIAFEADICILQHMRLEVILTLRAAIDEADKLGLAQDLRRIMESPASPELREVRRFAYVNCLAADVLLRRAGRALSKANSDLATDPSKGRSFSAFEAKYGELARFYMNVRRIS